MHRVFRPKQNFVYTTGPAKKRRSPGFSFTLLMFLLGLGLFLGGASMFHKRISCQVAVSDASDIVSAEVNRVITSIMAGGDYDGESFVSFEKNADGEISAISSNMARINALSAEILDRVVGATENYLGDARRKTAQFG